MSKRSGAVHRPMPSSEWCLRINEVSEALAPHMTLECCLRSRRVCSTWKRAFSKAVPGLSLVQPSSAAAASSLASRAAAAFPGASIARIQLYHTGQEASFDLTGDDDDAAAAVELQLDCALAERPAAAKAMLEQMTRLPALRRLHLSTSGLHSRALRGLVPHLLPDQLHVLDLTEAKHGCEVLPAIAQHLPHLQELVLGLVHPWSSSGVVALARAPCLRQLTCSLLPAPGLDTGLGALTQLTHLSLKLLDDQPPPAGVQPGQPLVILQDMPAHDEDTPTAAAIRQLSSLTRLCCLEVHLASIAFSLRHAACVRDWDCSAAWAEALAGMHKLQELCVRNITLTDGFLCAVGGLEGLEALMLHLQDSSRHRLPAVSLAGTEALRKVGYVELHLPKFFRFCHAYFTHLPNVYKFVSCWQPTCRTGSPNLVCTCDLCLPW